MGKRDTGDWPGRSGGDGPVGEDELGRIRQKVREWNDRAGDFFDRRDTGDRARFCVWDGQSSDGRIWKEANGGKTPSPFNGASDQRIRWADGAVLDKQAVVLTALALADKAVKATGAAAGRKARNLTVMLRWMIGNMGAEWFRQWKILASHYFGDSPAVAVMGVEWRREERLEYVTVTADELLEMYAAARTAAAEREGIAPAEALGDGAARLREFLETGEDGTGIAAEAEAAALVRNAFGITERAAERVVREIAEEGESEFPLRVYGDEGPVLTAMREGEDFIVPDNAVSFDKCGMWFRTRWMTRDELEAQEAEDGWSADFIGKTLDGGSEGRAVLEDAVGQTADNEAKKDKWQVVWVYHTAVNGDGVRAKYVTVISHADVTAFGRRLLRWTRGRWPAVFFQREVANKYLMESRGLPEIAAPHQGAAKKLRDTCTDNGIVGGLPPFLAKGTNAQRNAYLEPLKKIDLRINEDLAWMQPPQFPAAAQKVEQKIWEELRDYLGEPREGGPEQIPALRRQEEVQWFLAQVYDVLRAMVEMAQDHASEEWLAEVTDERKGVAGLRREDVAGRFRVSVSFNADDLDPAAVREKVAAVGASLLAIDRSKVIDTTPIVSTMLRRMMPDVSEDALMTADRASEQELEDEARNLVSLRAGIMPQMDTEGNWNYGARLAWWEEQTARNPAMFDDLAEDKRAGIGEWLKALAQQETQFGENRAVGRTGAGGVEEK